MPNPHPFFVHFPIALLTLGLLVDAWASVRRDGQCWKFGGWLQAAGTAGLLAAVATGVLAGQSEAIPALAGEAFDAHQQAAFVGAVACSVLGLWRLGARGVIVGSRRVVFLLLYAAAVGTVLLAGWYGGKLVFEFGVGVNPV